MQSPAAAAPPEDAGSIATSPLQAPAEVAEGPVVVGLAPVPLLSTPAEWPWKSASPTAAAADAAAAGAAIGVAAVVAVTPTGAAAAAAASVDAAADPVAVLTFAEHMWERFELLWTQRVLPSQQLLEQVTDLLRGRAELERKYGESLSGFNVGSKLEPEVNSVHVAVDAVLANLKNRADQSAELAESIDQDIVAFFEAVIKQHREVSQRLFKDVQVLTKYLADKKHIHDKLARRYAARCAEAELFGQECIQGLAMKTADRLKLAHKATLLSKQARAAEHEYYASIDQANKAQHLYDSHLPGVLSSLQDLEEKRGMCLKDGLMKLAVYETSWLRNLQYDLEATVKNSEGADGAQDVQGFIRQHGEQRKRAAQLGPQAFWVVGKPKAAAISPVQAQIQASIRRFMDEEMQAPMHALLAEGAMPDAAEGIKEQLEQLRVNITDARRRSSLVQVIRAEILARVPAASDLSDAMSVCVAPATLDALVPLIKAFLDACDEQADTWCGRDIMVIVNRIYALNESGKQVLLLTRCYNHALWNKVTFWEEVLLIGLCEAHSAEAVTRRTLPAGSQFTQPAMTSFLQHFLGYMMAFGISFDQARNSVWSTLRKNTQVLGPSCKSYATLLIQAYETSAAAAVVAAGAGASGAGQASTPNGGGAASWGTVPEPQGGGRNLETAGGSMPPTASPPAAMEEDDFEAVAMGLPVGEDAAAGDDSADEEEQSPSSPARDEEEPAEGGAAPAADVLS